MKPSYPIKCAGPAALLLLIASCQSPQGDGSMALAGPAGPTEAHPRTDSGGAMGPEKPAEAAPMEAPARSAKAVKVAQPAAKPAPSGAQSNASRGKQAAAKGPAPKAAKRPSLDKQLSEAKEKKVEAAQALRYAEAELELAEMGAAGTEIEVVEALRSARAELEAAQESLSRFEEKERPLKAAKAELTVSDAEERLLSAKTDLDGLVKIFAEEEEASSKEEILRRGRRKVARALQAFEMATKEAEIKVEDELPARLKELSGNVQAKDSALRSAQSSAAKKRRSAELSVEKATDSADAKKRDMRKAAGKVTSLQKKVNDQRQKAQGAKKGAPKKAPKKQ